MRPTNKTLRKSTDKESLREKRRSTQLDIKLQGPRVAGSEDKKISTATVERRGESDETGQKGSLT